MEMARIFENARGTPCVENLLCKLDEIFSVENIFLLENILFFRDFSTHAGPMGGYVKIYLVHPTACCYFYQQALFSWTACDDFYAQALVDFGLVGVFAPTCPHAMEIYFHFRAQNG